MALKLNSQDIEALLEWANEIEAAVAELRDAQDRVAATMLKAARGIQDTLELYKTTCKEIHELRADFEAITDGMRRTNDDVLELKGRLLLC